MKALFSFLWKCVTRIELYLRVWLSLTGVRLRLSSLGYASFEKLPIKTCSHRTRFSPSLVAAVVQRVARFVPGALCLAQAVTAQRMLARFGFDTTMRIGVKSEPGGNLKAHAWLMFDDRVILGGSPSQLEQYRVLTDMNAATF